MSTRFFDAACELRPYVAFGFVFPSYRRRGKDHVRRVPTARASIYFAENVSVCPGAPLISGVFCEGPHSRAFTVTSEAGQLVGVKLSAGALRALVGVEARELRDETISLEDLWGRAARELTERIQEAPSAAERAAILEQELIARCRSYEHHDHVALAVSKVIEECGGKVTIRELCDRAGYGHRALLKRFDAWVGLTPKQCARLERVRAAIAQLGAPRGRSWADFAVALGFCDQAHMIHEFNDLVGVAPGTFCRDPRPWSPRGAPAAGREALPNREQRLYQTVGMVSDWVGEA